MKCRHTDYPNCTCDSVSCVMLRSTANPAGLECLAPSLFGDPIVRDELVTLRAENERLAAACREARAEAIEECARWHDAGSSSADYLAEQSMLDHAMARRHEEHARQHRYAAEQLRTLKSAPGRR